MVLMPANHAPAALQPVVFVGNLAAVGGAMFVSDFSDTLLTGPNLVVANNTAATGGGLALLGSYFQLHQVGRRAHTRGMLQYVHHM